MISGRRKVLSPAYGHATRVGRRCDRYDSRWQFKPSGCTDSRIVITSILERQPHYGGMLWQIMRIRLYIERAKSG